jgi:transcriptional antiterminator NusG
MAMKYYIVQAYSGFEDKVRASLQERIKNAGLEEYFGEILVPAENVTAVRGGKQRTERRKFYPGYVFVQMEMQDKTWHLVKDTPKVTGFLGDQNPTSVPQREIDNIKARSRAVGAAAPEGQLRRERPGEGGGRRVRELHGRGRGRSPRAAEAQGDGHHLRPPDGG